MPKYETLIKGISYFKENPLYAADFFRTKFITQWTEPTYHVLLATVASYGDRLQVVDNLFYGNLNEVFIQFCNSYQFILYLGVLLFLISKINNNESQDIIGYVFIISLIGGILFHTFWEGKARYVFPYCMFLIPYAASGISSITDIIVKLIHKK